MPRKSSHGKYILSAGEIGAYCVCPEAWRLAALEKASRLRPYSVALGRKLHIEWAHKYDEAVFLTRAAKWLIALLALACVVYAIT